MFLMVCSVVLCFLPVLCCFPVFLWMCSVMFLLMCVRCVEVCAAGLVFLVLAAIIKLYWLGLMVLVMIQLT